MITGQRIYIKVKLVWNKNEQIIWFDFFYNFESLETVLDCEAQQSDQIN